MILFLLVAAEKSFLANFTWVAVAVPLAGVLASATLVYKGGREDTRVTMAVQATSETNKAAQALIDQLQEERVQGSHQIEALRGELETERKMRGGLERKVEALQAESSNHQRHRAQCETDLASLRAELEELKDRDLTRKDDADDR